MMLHDIGFDYGHTCTMTHNELWNENEMNEMNE